jgi:hypothetical protein
MVNALELSLGGMNFEYEYRHIQGMVKVSACTSPTDMEARMKARIDKDVWYNAGDWAWEVEAAIEFVVPIPLDADDHSQTWVWLSSRNQYRARIIEQLEDLKGDAIETLPYDDSESSREAKQTVTDALLVLRPGG